MESDKRKPENNPWFLLATLHGEPAPGCDELHARNRTAWNRFMAAELTEEARALLIKEGRCSAEDLEPFSAEELSKVEKRFAARHRQATEKAGTVGAKPPLPNLKRGLIDFSNVTFDRRFCVKGFFFPIRANDSFGWIHFSGATFSDQADFSGTTFFVEAHFSGVCFSGQADFSGATFSDRADFSGATFSKLADFRGATFSNRAVFSHTIFSGWTSFVGATFCDQTYFSDARFSNLAFFRRARFSDGADFSGGKFCGRADFSGANFCKETSFVNAKMEGPPSFENAKFSTMPPQFFEAKLHQGTVWRGVPPWPLPGKHEQAGSFIDAYACLKLEMDRLKKHEDELDFFALELQSSRVLHGDWQPVSELKIPEKTITLRPRKVLGRSFALPPFTIKARTIRLSRPTPGLAIAFYGQLSDYGRSYVRPLCGLLITIAIGVLPFWWHLSGFFEAVGLSFANTFGVLGFRKDLVDPHVIAGLPSWLKVLAAAQTIAGIVLLFLFGLAIRNRFRMK